MYNIETIKFYRKETNMNFRRKRNSNAMIGIASYGRPVLVLLVIDGRCMRRSKVCVNVTWICCQSCDVLLIEFKPGGPRFDYKSIMLMVPRIWLVLVGRWLWRLSQNVDAEKVVSWWLTLTNIVEQIICVLGGML